MQQLTLAIVKPDAFRKQSTGAILARYEKEGFKIKAARVRWLSIREAESFYAVHRERPFFSSLTSFMASGPVLTLVLEAENAVLRHRDLLGATDPAKAAPQTLRSLFGASIEENAVHGSDSEENARLEIALFFSGAEIF